MIYIYRALHSSIFFAASQAPKRRDGDSRLADLADRPSGEPPAINGGFHQWGIPNSWMVYPLVN